MVTLGNISETLPSVTQSMSCIPSSALLHLYFIQTFLREANSNYHDSMSTPNKFIQPHSTIMSLLTSRPKIPMLPPNTTVFLIFTHIRFLQRNLSQLHPLITLTHQLMLPQIFHYYFHIHLHHKSPSKLQLLIPVNLPVIISQVCHHHSHLKFHMRRLYQLHPLITMNLPFLIPQVYYLISHIKFQYSNLSRFQLLIPLNLPVTIYQSFHINF